MTRPTAGDAPALHPLRWWQIDQLEHLEQVLFPGDSPWTSAMFFAELAAGHHYSVALEGERVIGYAGIALVGPPDEPGGEAEVQTIGIDPEFQGRGLGRQLLADLLAAAPGRRVLLEVRTDNVPAISLYESVGFVRLGLRRHYYQPSGADAWTMEKAVKAA
ncbi:ribosomal-protein-alanine N-acetyltransferase [Nakamurella sp. YIM 132087]|uniref:Ribosomal-protein-alanine N-acetyltransferase n=1 Tax=Nakamurella alba TaxID=2665158 RepID=A0A7K1FM79_9ACTN|nr:ribosomal protein S18-alanine N-acetyltransferase [Nakamurella alba]MTD14343.1 ribosomal-protein-alanine N-acetyltransferase [Nakamurella alba]